MDILIIGGGSWGRSLYNLFSKNHNLHLKIRDNKEKIAGYKCVNLYSEIENIQFDYVIFAVPSSNVPEAFSELDMHNNIKNSEIILASKGAYHENNILFSKFFQSHQIEVSFLSGPNFANEIEGNKSGSIIASQNIEKAKKIVKDLANENIEFHPSDDRIGVQICGIYKNICAILFGYLNAKKESENLKAKILTECIAELSYIIKRLGGNPQSAYSYSGIGDIVLSCYSNKSRNYKFGVLLHENSSLPQSFDFELYEGVYSVKTLSIICEEFMDELEILQKVVSLIMRIKK